MLAPKNHDPNALVTVYDLAGKPHQMSRMNAGDMIRNCQWSLTSSDVVASLADAPAQPMTEAAIDALLAADRAAGLLPPLPPAPAKAAAGTTDVAACTTPCTPDACACTGNVAIAWEDLVQLGKDRLRKAAMCMGVEVDGRANDKRLVATIDSMVDARLTASGDTEGAASPDPSEAVDIFEGKKHAIAKRRLRAFDLEAKRLGHKDGLATFGGTAIGFVESLAEPI